MGVTQTWYYALEQDEGMPSLERFKDLCHLWFGLAIRSNCLAKLAWLPFHATVQEYQERFNVLVCHTPNLLPVQKADLFIGGVLEHIQVDFKLREPQDL